MFETNPDEVETKRNQILEIDKNAVHSLQHRIVNEV